MVLAAGNILGETVGEFTNALPDFVDVAIQLVDSLLLGITSNLDAISDGAVDAVVTLIDGLIEMAPEIIVTGVLLIGKLEAGLWQAMPELIAKIPEMIVQIVEGFAANKEEFSQIGADIVNGILDSMKVTWEELTSWLEQAWEELVNWWNEDAIPWLADLGNMFAQTQAVAQGYTYSIDGSHAGGLSYVPWDGYLAELHQGEMVLTRSEAEALRRGQTATVGGSVSYGGFVFHVYAAEGQNVEQIAEAVFERFQTEVERKEAAFA